MLKEKMGQQVVDWERKEEGGGKVKEEKGGDSKTSKDK